MKRKIIFMSVITFWQFIIYAVSCSWQKKKSNYQNFLSTVSVYNIGCPTTYQTRHFFNNSKTNEDIAMKQTHTTDTFLFISHTMNVLLFKSRCSIFIGFRIIKEMPGLVGSGTPVFITAIYTNSFQLALYCTNKICSEQLSSHKLLC